jgi:8-oxo-dGTP diphosphatase
MEIRVVMREKIKGILAGVIFRCIALLTMGQISPILSACVIIEQGGKILLVHRSDGLGYTIPGGIVRYKETVDECVRREAREETGYDVRITDIVGIYSSIDRDPRFRAASIAYKGQIVGGKEQHSGEGQTCWCEPEAVFGHMAFDCETMLKDYFNGQRCLS